MTTTTKRNVVLLASVLALVLGLALFAVHSLQPGYAIDTETAAKADRSTLLGIQNAFTSIADELKPAVVFIMAEKTVTSPSMPDFDDLFQGFPFGPGQVIPRGGQKRQATSTGSGVIVRNDGYILTNDHVVGGADRVTVRLDDGREFVGKVMRDPRHDLAVVKIEAAGLPTAKIGDSDSVKVGQWAIAIGSPFGLTNSLTVGVVSAVARQASVPDRGMPEGRRDYSEMIQTDASINPGNSGGPLVDIDGRIIGINTMIESPTGTNAGIGFAVPSNTAKYVMDQLIAHGKVSWGRIGVEIRDITPAAAKTLGTSKGALVNSIEDESPAAKGGLQPMDVITQVDGKDTADVSALRRIIERTKPGTVVPITVLRDGKKVTLKVTVADASDQSVASAEDVKATKTGITVTELTPEVINRLRLSSDVKGVMVRSVDTGSPASRSRPPIEPGDVITKINDSTISNVAQFNKAVSDMKAGDTALLLIIRRDRTTISEMTLD